MGIVYRAERERKGPTGPARGRAVPQVDQARLSSQVVNPGKCRPMKAMILP